MKHDRLTLVQKIQLENVTQSGKKYQARIYVLYIYIYICKYF